MPDLEQFDLIVVGGGPGGSTVASFVAMHGHRVLLLEQQQFPRYSIGESLLPSTVHGVCRLLGVRDQIESANFVRKYGGTWRWGKEQALWSFFFHDNEQLYLEKSDYAYQVERSKFDDILLRHAERKGVDVRERHSVVGVMTENGRIGGVRYVDAEGRERAAQARFVADASGHQSRLYRNAGDRVPSKFFQNVALFCYYKDAGRRPAPRQGDILCAACDIGWFWFIPLSDTLTSVGAVVGHEHTDLLRGDRGEAMRRLVGHCPTVAELLAPATRVTEGVYGECRIRSDYSYCNTRFFAPGLVLIGDSACFIDPVFSTGVHLATYSGLLAARSINASLSNVTDEQRCFEEFEHRYRLEFQNLYDFLIMFYDMNHDKDSYFWNARKIVNTDEAANEAFVRLVAGMSTSGSEFFEKRAGIGERTEATLRRHFYSEPSSPPQEAPLDEAAEARFAELRAERIRRNAAGAENHSLGRGEPFPRTPVRPNGLIASEDGLSWREPLPVGVEV